VAGLRLALHGVNRELWADRHVAGRPFFRYSESAGREMLRFHENGKLAGFISRLVDVLWLNLLWLACCLPIVTIGASTVAAHSVCLKMVDGEEGYIARDFFKAFKANFLQGTVLWLINAAAVYSLYLDWQIVTKAGDPSVILIVVSIVWSVVVFIAFIYSYPLIARYRNTVVKTISNSTRISLRFFGRSIVLALVLLLEIGLFSWNEVMIVIGALIGPMILIYTVAGISKGIFKVIDRESGERG
jgi:uncharacterized membrane protein YesL